GGMSIWRDGPRGIEHCVTKETLARTSPTYEPLGGKGKSLPSVDTTLGGYESTSWVTDGMLIGTTTWQPGSSERSFLGSHSSVRVPSPRFGTCGCTRGTARAVSSCLDWSCSSL